MAMWLTFLESKNFKIHREVPFLQFIRNEDGPLIFTDSSGNLTLGFGCVFLEKGQWTAVRWPISLFQEQKPDITLLELYTIVIALKLWAPQLCSKQVQLCSDNEATVYLVNAKTSNKEINMNLLHHLTLTCMYFQIYITIWHENRIWNRQVDALSRGAFHTSFNITKDHMDWSPNKPVAHKLAKVKEPQLKSGPSPATISYKEKIINAKTQLISSHFNKEMSNSRQYFKQKKIQQGLQVKLHAGPKNEYFI